MNSMYELLCTYKMAFIGEIQTSNIGIKNQTHSMAVKVTKRYSFGDDRDNDHGSTVNIKLHSSCRSFLLQKGLPVLVLHNSMTDMLFDGDSVIFNLDYHKDNHLKNIIYEFFQHMKNNMRKCPHNEE